MRVGLIVSARMGSSRLPGKTLMPVGDRSLLGLMLERLQGSAWAEGLVLATSREEQDDPLVPESERYGVRCFRGSESDVLSRVCEAARTFGFDVVVRLTGDCPLVDPAVVDRCVRVYAEGNHDLVTTKFNFPQGIDCEVVSRDLLERILTWSEDRRDREHVTLYLWNHRDRFRGLSVPAPKGLDRPDCVLTVDEEDDLARLRAVASAFGREGIVSATGEEIVAWLEDQPGMIRRRQVPPGWGRAEGTATC